MSLPEPSYNDDVKSFAFTTVRDRWPKILNGAIGDLEEQVKKSPSNAETGNDIISKLRALLKAFQNDEIVAYFSEKEVSLNSSLSLYNAQLSKLNEKKKVTWLTGPWLFLECYLYALLNVYFISSPASFWHTYDVFNNLKNSTFQQSELGVVELCKRYRSLSEQLGEHKDEGTLKALFHEFADISLWGNATDLSLLAGSVSLEDIQSVQGEENRKKNEKNILVNDLDAAWKHLNNSKKERLDIVLDNAGFELFADLIFSLFALDSNLTKTVVLHCKSIPWFVSDVMPKDFLNLLGQLQDPNFFSKSHNSEDDNDALNAFVHELKRYYERGAIKVQTHPYWTLCNEYWTLPKATDLYNDLLKSDLVIFKGDLNYRKLTGDLLWNKTTAFSVAIQDLATSKLPILALRTCKADVVVGMPEGLDEKVAKEYSDMGKDGHFWPSSGKWAVVSFWLGYDV